MGIDSIWSKLLKTVGFFAERLDLAKLRLENHSPWFGQTTTEKPRKNEYFGPKSESQK